MASSGAVTAFTASTIAKLPQPKQACSDEGDRGFKFLSRGIHNRSLETETQDITKSSLQAITASPAVDAEDFFSEEELSVQVNNILKIPYWLLSGNALQPTSFAKFETDHLILVGVRESLEQFYQTNKG